MKNQKKKLKKSFEIFYKFIEFTLIKDYPILNLFTDFFINYMK